MGSARKAALGPLFKIRPPGHLRQIQPAAQIPAAARGRAGSPVGQREQRRLRLVARGGGGGGASFIERRLAFSQRRAPPPLSARAAALSTTRRRAAAFRTGRHPSGGGTGGPCADAAPSLALHGARAVATTARRRVGRLPFSPSGTAS
jgi:hypothetical protein